LLFLLFFFLFAVLVVVVVVVVVVLVVVVLLFCSVLLRLTLQQFMKIGIKYMGDAYLPTASNASFMCGKLCEYCPGQALPYYQELCEHSSRLLTQKKLGDAVDNTVGMLCRMIMANLEAVPIDMVCLPSVRLGLFVCFLNLCYYIFCSFLSFSYLYFFVSNPSFEPSR
jgi:hypothetical protein